MPPTKGELWKFFHAGEKQNSTHYKAYCLGCINKHRPSTVIDAEQDEPTLQSQKWFKEACQKAGFVRGEKSAMIAHLIGSKACRNASRTAKQVAKRLRGDTAAASDADDEAADETSTAGPSKKRKIIAGVLKQQELKVYKGITIPFSDEQAKAIEKQFLRATISANLPFRWTEDIEVIKLFLMFRSAAGDVIPARKTLAGRLLDDEGARVEENLENTLRGNYVVLA